MAARILQSLTDDSPDFRKQIGCMTGIFQLFDRQNMLTGGRRIVGHSPQRLPPGMSHFNGGTLGRESDNAQLKSSSEHSLNNMQDRQRLSTESSRASCSSSSRSSSFSSLDCNRASQLEPSSFAPSILQSDIRDFVKDSMYREVQGLSNKHKSIHEKQMTAAELKESLRVLSNLQEAPHHRNEPKELSRSSSYHSENGLSFPVSKDAPRFSYDDSKIKSSQKPRDLPRLSLDSSRPPSVVAKLMGLEMLPNEDSVSISSSFEEQDSAKPIQLSTSPCWRNPDRSMKPLSRFPMEPAPWKQIDWTKGSRKQASRSSAKAPAKGLTTFPSVYSEIENRLRDLEFGQSGKDLRALKQILETMQSKRFLGISDEGQDSNIPSHSDYEQKSLSTKRSVDNRNSSTNRTVCAKMYESPIVVKKSAKLVQKSGIPSVSVIPSHGFSGGNVDNNKKGVSSGRSSKDPILKSNQRENAANSGNSKDNRTLRSMHTSARQLAKNGPDKNSGSITPRMQQKKPDSEKRSRAPNNSKLMPKRLSNKQQTESNSTGGRRRPKVSNSQQGDQLSEVSFGSRNLSSHENEDSATSNENTIKKSSSEEDSAEFGCVPPEHSSPVSVLDNVGDKHDFPSPMKYVRKTLKVDAFNDKETNPNEHSSVDNFASSFTESSGTFVINRKKLQSIDNLVQKLKRLNSSHDEAQTDYIASLCDNNTNPDNRYVSEILLASGLLLRDLADFQFHPSGHPINPELFIVLEQTKASKTTQLKKNERYHRKLVFDAVNEILATKLGFACESSEPWSRPVKLAKKALNAQKLLRELCHEIEGFQCKNAKCSSDGEGDDGWKNILREDVMNRSDRWIGFDGEVSGAVLDIERLIFKDLVDEVVHGESAGLITNPGKKMTQAVCEIV